MDESLNEELVARLIVCSRYLRNFRHGNMSQNEILRIIGDAGGSIPQARLRDELSIRPASVSELISKLVNYGLVTKAQDEKDKRAYVLELTDEGWGRYSELVDYSDAYLDLFSVLDGTEKDELSRILAKLNDEWLAKDPSILKGGHAYSTEFVRNEDGSLSRRTKRMGR